MHVARKPHRQAWSSAVALLAAVALLFALGGVPSAPRSAAAAGSRAADVRVIVQATSVEDAAAAVRAVGGETSESLPIVAGVAAVVPAVALASLAAVSGVLAVTPDAAMQVQGTIDMASRPPSVYGPVVRADRLTSAGYAGSGVTVALLDTGISETPDLVGRVLKVPGPLGVPADCVNLSGEPTCADGYGHGTFLAGIIAGDGTASGGEYSGVAPAVNLISVKVGSSDGAADVSNVLAGIQWVVSFKDRYNIRVLNLSLGTDSLQSWRIDPLNKAVERAWAAGIVVVVSASNRGPAAGTISKPGDDPHVITVGATDDAGTLRLGDDRMPDFSGRGPTVDGMAKPDVVAPGAHIVSLRAIGSAIDTRFPHYIDAVYRQGSGTSMSAAVVSGLVADILSANRSWSPNRVKYALMETARPDAVLDPNAIGRGLVDGYAAAFRAPAGEANVGLAWSTGLGSLDLSRGSVSVILNDPAQTVVDGTLTAQLLAWRLTDLLGIWNELTWLVSPYWLVPWFSAAWNGNPWEGHNWEGCTSDGKHEECFYGHNWEGSTWYGAWD